MNDKSALRAAWRAIPIDPAERARQSERLCRHILASDLYRDARVIGGYMPMKREADITPVLADILATGRTLALPLCGPAPHMTLRRITTLDDLSPGRYGILEPMEETEIIPVDALDLLLVPLAGIDPTGMRLGKGGGYYDCLLDGQTVPNLGCALTWQWLPRIPADPWDRPLSACADEHGIHLFGNTK